jgi:hypothetical protein
MKNIFRVSVDIEHFTDTIEKGKVYTQLLPFVTPIEKKCLAEIAQHGVLRYWGSIAGISNQKTFMRIQQGDEILFYRAGKYIAIATIAFSTINSLLARYSWGERKDKATWELMYFLKDAQIISVEAKIVNKAFGYKENAPVMGFSMVSEQITSQFVSTYGSVADFVKQLQNTNELVA